MKRGRAVYFIHNFDPLCSGERWRETLSTQVAFTMSRLRGATKRFPDVTFTILRWSGTRYPDRGTSGVSYERKMRNGKWVSR
jgi:hypothetical protein